jgi:hypothetical protein
MAAELLVCSACIRWERGASRFSLHEYVNRTFHGRCCVAADTSFLVGFSIDQRLGCREHKVDHRFAFLQTHGSTRSAEGKAHRPFRRSRASVSIK